jgi:hypothetical protein
VSLNLSHVFVRYPDVAGVAEVVEAHLRPLVRERHDIPRHVCVATGSPWIGVFPAGDSAAPELAERLSRSLEAHALWFGLAGRSLAWRIRKYAHGRLAEDLLSPQELFSNGDDFTLPPYLDAEAAVHERLTKEGIPDPYVLAFSAEFGADDRDEPDSAVVAPASWSDSGLTRESFAHRLPRRPSGVRTLFDQFDDERTTVTDAVVLRGRYDEGRARSLLALLARLAARRAVPPGWSVSYRLESPAGPALLDPIHALAATVKPTYRLEL